MIQNDTIPFWAHIHGASSHFPIAMMFVSFAFDFGALVFRRPQWRIVAFWTLIVAAIIAVPTIITGFTGMLGWFHVDPYKSASLSIHRYWALGAGIGIILLAIWRTVSIERKHAASITADILMPTPRPEFIAYLCVLTLATAAIGYAGYLGAEVSQGS